MTKATARRAMRVTLIAAGLIGWNLMWDYIIRHSLTGTELQIGSLALPIVFMVAVIFLHKNWKFIKRYIETGSLND